MKIRIAIALWLCVLVGTARSQTLSLLAVRAGMPALPTKPAGATVPDAYAVTMLARVIAAEAGGDSFSTLIAKEAVGAAVMNEIRKAYGVHRVTGGDIRRLELNQPGYVSSAHDGNAYLYMKDDAWFRAHGYADCLTAARVALGGTDPSHGATNWYDNSIGQPYASSKIVVTGHVRTAGNTLVFYKFR